MNKYVRLFLQIALFVAIIFGVQIIYQSLSKNYDRKQSLVVESNPTDQADKEEQKEDETEKSEMVTKPKFLDFTVEDAEGEMVSLSSFVGKPMVVNFWASWCSPCKNELPDFQQAYEELGDTVTFVMVNLTDGVRETVEKAKKFIDGKQYTFPVYFDNNLEASTKYAAYSIPMTYFFNAEGEVVAKAEGMIDMDTLLQGIKMIEE